jgi:hypothetical protein
VTGRDVGPVLGRVLGADVGLGRVALGAVGRERGATATGVATALGATGLGRGAVATGVGRATTGTRGVSTGCLATARVGRLVGARGAGCGEDDWVGAGVATGATVSVSLPKKSSSKPPLRTRHVKAAVSESTQEAGGLLERLQMPLRIKEANDDTSV